MSSLDPIVLICRVVGRIKLRPGGLLEKGDLLGVGYLAFLDAQRDFVRGRGSLSGYAYTRIYWAILAEAKKWARYAQESTSNCVVERGHTPKDKLEIRESLLRLFRNAGFSEEECAYAIYLWGEDRTPEWVARKMHTTIFKVKEFKRFGLRRLQGHQPSRRALSEFARTQGGRP